MDVKIRVSMDFKDFRENNKTSYCNKKYQIMIEISQACFVSKVRISQPIIPRQKNWSNFFWLAIIIPFLSESEATLW